jgi:hypothetical protein
MITITRGKAILSAALVVLMLIVLTAGSLVAQTATPAPGTTATSDPMGMMEAATPGTDGTPAAVDMQQMMAQCMAMMEMMMGMMGEGMMGAATPGAGMDGMGTPAADM